MSKALKRPVSPDTAPDPRTASWAARGLALTGTTRAEQHDDLQARPERSRGAKATTRGTVTPAPIDLAVSDLSSEKDPLAQFRQATRFLNLRTSWATSVLRIKSTQKPGEAP